MRRFVAALFACCAPRRAPSTASFGEGDIADPRDIDEGSCVSSTSDGTIDPREMFGVDDKGGGLSGEGSESDEVNQVDGGSGNSKDPDIDHQAGDNSCDLRHRRSLSEKHAVTVGSESEFCKSGKADNCSVVSESSGTKSLEREVNGIETDNSDGSKQVGIVASDNHVGLEGGQLTNNIGKNTTTSECDELSADKSKDTGMCVGLTRTEVFLDQSPLSENSNDEPPSEDDKTFSYDYSCLEDDVTSTLSAEKPSVNKSTDTDAVKDLISVKSDLQSNTSTEPPETLLQNGHETQPEKVIKTKGKQAGIVPEIRLSGYISSDSSDSDMSSDTDLEDDFLFSKAQPPELKNNDYDGLMITPKDDSVLLEGYLYKRSHNTFKTWKRRYFMIKENQLHCHKRSKGSKEENNKIISEDLRISQVKSTEEQDRRYCFELIMPSKKIFLQADSQKVKDAWIKSLQCGIEAAIHNTTATNEVDNKKPNGIPDENMKSGNSPEILKLLSDIKNMPGNDVCADCANREPVWASINLGITLCIMCSGIHRNLGVHISKVRSIELDIWEHEQCLLMLRLGNAKVNTIFEHLIVDPYRKPGIASNLAEKEVWIRAKYDEKLFLENRDYIKVKVKKRHQSVAAGSYKATSISYDPATITSHHSSLKVRTKRDVAMRPLSKIFQNINRKKRGGSDGAAYIDTEQDPDDEGRAMSPQYALLGTEEPNGEGTTHTDTCVPDNLLSNATLSCSSPDLLSETENKNSSQDGLNLNLIGPLALNNSLFVSSKLGDVDSMFRYICEGADINFRNSTSSDSTPLIQAVHSNSREAVQLLLIHGADVNQIDDKRQTALHHATILGRTDLACLLLKKGADHRRVNTDNKDALDIAVAEERASLVTVLRFIRINEASDPTSQQLLNEFSRRPAVDSER